MEKTIPLYEKIILIISNILIIPSLILNYYFYNDYKNQYYMYVILSSVIISFVSITLPCYTILKLGTKKNHKWLIMIIGIFSSIHCFTLVYILLNESYVKNIKNTFLLILSIIRTTLIFLTIISDLLLLVYNRLNYYLLSYSDYDRVM